MLWSQLLSDFGDAATFGDDFTLLVDDFHVHVQMRGKLLQLELIRRDRLTRDFTQLASNGFGKHAVSKFDFCNDDVGRFRCGNHQPTRCFRQRANQLDHS